MHLIPSRAVLGATVEGLDVSQPLDPAHVEAIVQDGWCYAVGGMEVGFYYKAIVAGVGALCVVAGIRALFTKRASVARHSHDDPRSQYDDSTVEKTGFAAMKQGVNWIILGGGLLVIAFKV